MPTDITPAALEAAGFEHDTDICDYAIAIDENSQLELFEFEGDWCANISDGCDDVTLERSFADMEDVLELLRVLKGTA